MTILPIVVQYLKTLRLILMLVFGAIMDSLIHKSKATCWYGLTRKVGK